MITLPSILVPRFDAIPRYLKTLPWAVWTAEPREGKPGKFNKAPRSPITGIKIGTNKPNLFGTFENAKAAYESGGYSGVGLLLINSGIIGVDIDDYRDTVVSNPEVAVWIDNAIKTGAYCERSPSGNGLRLFYYDSNFKQSKKSGSLEIYCALRFLTITGHCVNEIGEL